MAAPPAAAPRSHYRQQVAVTAASVTATRQTVRAATASPQSWDALVDNLVRVLVRYQTLSTVTATRTLAAAADSDPITGSTSFAGQTSLGYPLADPLTVLVEDLDRQIAALPGRVDRAQALATPALLQRLVRMVSSEVTDAGREAAHVEIVGRPDWQNYIRVLNLPSCKRCVVLAGRIYRDLDHFDRHPGDDCQMWPVQDLADARRQRLVTDPAEAIASGKVTDLSAADTRAIVEGGADPAQVINATRGTSQPGVTSAITTEIFGRMVKATVDGTTAKAQWRRDHPNLPVRLRPGSIYEHAKDRADAIRLLKLYGYITT